MALDAQSKGLQKLINSFGMQPEKMAPEEVRAAFAVDPSRPPGPKFARVEDKTITVDGVKIPIRIYAASKKEGLPIAVYFHGGGWVLGSLDSDDPACRQVAKTSGAIVVSVNYRHAPEAPFPAAADDCLAAVLWLAKNAKKIGGDPSRIAVFGWSAGGNLAAVVAQKAAAAGVALRGQALITPVTDSDFSRGSYKENGAGYVLTKPFMEWFWNHYAPKVRPQGPRSVADSGQGQGAGRRVPRLCDHRRARPAARRGRGRTRWPSPRQVCRSACSAGSGTSI